MAIKRPHNHPDNLDQNGKLKVSENVWDLKESLRIGDVSTAFNSNRLFEYCVENGITLDAGSVEPSNLLEAYDLLYRAVKHMTSCEYEAIAWNGAPPSTVRAAVDSLADSTSMFYLASAHWDGQPETVRDAINRIAAELYILKSNQPIS